MTFDGVAPESGLSYGASFDVFATEGAQVGFLWSQQQSALLGKGRGTTKFADMKVNQQLPQHVRLQLGRRR